MERDVYIIGNMASGKTTLARLLGERVGKRAVYVPEPVDKNPFLPLYMRDQARWGMACMARYFLDYLAEWAAATAGGPFAYHFVDAGTLSNRLLYGRYLHEELIIRDDEYRLYCDLCDAAARAYGMPEPHAFVYVRAAPQTCWQRMQARGWGFQVDAVERVYIEKLYRYLEAMAEMVARQGYRVLALSSEDLDYARAEGQAEAVQRVAAFLGEAVAA